MRECLDSIKAQTHTNLEVICIDDGSKDSTGTIIDEYVAKDKRFKVIHKPNSGYGDSMNKGLDSCTGDYIGIVESDDWVEPDMFKTLLTTAKENNLDLVRCCWYEGPTGTESENHQDWVKKDEVYCPLDQKDVFLQQPSIWASLYRRDLLEEGRKIRFLPTPGASYQDTSFAFKAYTKSKRFKMLDKPYHHYRINPNSSVSSPSKIYCIIDEWEEMRRWVCEDPAMRNFFSGTPLLPKICYGGHTWNYERLSQTVFKLLYLRKASLFFRRATADGVFNLYGFSRKRGGKVLQQVMDSPLDYHHERIAERLDIISKYEDYTLTSQDSANGQDLISVVVTCYNTSKYIYSCLKSILQQSYGNIEVICVDDCSTDDTKVLVHHMMRKDSRLSWLCTDKNSGLSASRNFGVSHCKGKYVLFVDGDDCLLPGAIARLYAAKQNDDDIVVGGAIIHYEGGKERFGALVESDRNYYTIKKEEKVNALTDVKGASKFHVSAWGKLLRLSVIKDNGIMFPEGLVYEDACFYWKYLCVAPHIHAISKPVYLYQRRIQGSIMNDTFSKKDRLAIQHVLILDDLYKFACERHLENDIKPILNNVYEPYFLFAYNNSPVSDYGLLLENMCRILKEQNVDTKSSPILDYISRYEEVTKAEIFINAFDGNKPGGIQMSPQIYKLNKKLKKYRRLTKLFALLSFLFLLLLIVILLLP